MSSSMARYQADALLPSIKQGVEARAAFVESEIVFPENVADELDGLNGIETIPLYSKVSNHNNKLSAVASDVKFILLDNTLLINEFYVIYI